MTATISRRAETTATIKTPMLGYLQGLHGRWRQEVRDVLDPARQDDSGVWMRWRAIQYLGTSFTRRVERERRAVASLHDRLTGAQAGHLWAGGELLAQLVGGAERLVGLCHRPGEFDLLALNLLNALEYWCEQVEDALGPIRWGSVPPESRILFETIADDELVSGS